ncbi:unnamed protein product [Meloidogyne enterolobii]|uniref:Uncharacterized protein n=1 Tax=Meloidogyne enterolobii TaxID=390850 RepID=A0ACB0Z682_MELEN
MSCFYNYLISCTHTVRIFTYKHLKGNIPRYPGNSQNPLNVISGRQMCSLIYELQFLTKLYLCGAERLRHASLLPQLKCLDMSVR